MAGRGREATLPAWMKAGAGPAAPGAPPPGNAPQGPPGMGGPPGGMPPQGPGQQWPPPGQAPPFAPGGGMHPPPHSMPGAGPGHMGGPPGGMMPHDYPPPPGQGLMGPRPGMPPMGMPGHFQAGARPPMPPFMHLPQGAMGGPPMSAPMPGPPLQMHQMPPFQGGPPSSAQMPNPHMSLPPGVSAAPGQPPLGFMGMQGPPGQLTIPPTGPTPGAPGLPSPLGQALPPTSSAPPLSGPPASAPLTAPGQHPLSQQPPGGAPQQQQQQPQADGAPSGQQQQQQQQQPQAQQQGQGLGQPPAKAGPWTEHTAPDGRKYYYNTETKKSRWDKPEELMSVQEKSEAAAVWREYTSPDGRTYYYNRATKESKWTMPEELRKAQEAAGGAVAADKGTVQVVALSKPQENGKGADGVKAEDEAGSSKASPSRDGESEADAHTANTGNTQGGESKSTPFQYATKAEAKDAFKELLASVNCASDWTWEQAMRVIVKDGRYGALKSLGERKACFNEYIQHRRNEEREEERKRAKRIREDFLRMLEDSKDIKPGMRYSKARDHIDEVKWKGIPESEKQDLFEDHMKERERKEREERRQNRKKRMAAFRGLLQRNPAIKASSQWRKWEQKLEGEEEFESLDKLDRLEVWKEHVRDLEKEEKEAEEKAKEDRRRQERKARDAFRDLVKKHKEQGLFGVKTRWKEYAPQVEKEEAYKAVNKNTSGATPRQLFEDVLEDLEEDYDKARGVLKEWVKDAEMEVSTSTSMETFLHAMDDAPEQVKAVQAVFKRTYWEELVGKAKDKEEQAAKKRRKAREDLTSLLRHTKSVKPETDWADFLKEHERAAEIRALGVDEAEEVFNEHIVKLKKKDEKRRRRDSSDSEVDEDKKDRKKRRSDDAEDDDRSHKKDRKKSSRKHDDDDGKSKKHKKDRKERRDDPEDSR